MGVGVGVSDGVIVTSQSNKALKSNVVQGSVVVVVERGRERFASAFRGGAGVFEEASNFSPLTVGAHSF